MPRVVIIGAGISGLSIAYRLHRLAPAVDVTVLESANRVGGCVRTDRLNGFTVECGPNGFLDSKPSTVELARELGLGDRMVPASDAAARNRYLFLGDRTAPPSRHARRPAPQSAAEHPRQAGIARRAIPPTTTRHGPGIGRGVCPSAGRPRGGRRFRRRPGHRHSCRRSGAAGRPGGVSAIDAHWKLEHGSVSAE